MSSRPSCGMVFRAVALLPSHHTFAKTRIDGGPRDDYRMLRADGRELPDEGGERPHGNADFE